MENDQRLSVIIPTHETRELTLRCLAALRQCDPQPYEVIVVDDGSTDNTADLVVREYPMYTVIRLLENVGFSAAANLGMARTSGDLLLLLNSDTEVEAPALGTVKRAFAHDSKLGIAGAALLHPDGTPQWSGGRAPNWLWYFSVASGIPAFLGKLPVWRRLRSPSGSRGGPVDWVAGTAMVIRRTVWEKVGPLDLSYHFYCQDIDLCTSAQEDGWKISIIPNFRVLHHLGGTISSNRGAVGQYNPELMWTDLLRFAGKRQKSASASNAFLALRLGGRLRILGRRLVFPIIPKNDRTQWRETTSVYVDALRALERTYRVHDPIQGP